MSSSCMCTGQQFKTSVIYKGIKERMKDISYHVEVSLGSRFEAFKRVLNFILLQLLAAEYLKKLRRNI